MPTKKLKWCDPRNFAQKIVQNYQGEDLVFLYSGLASQVCDSFSYLALFPKKKFVGDEISAAKNFIKNCEQKAFGYFSYELAGDLEKLPPVKKSHIKFAKICLIEFALIFEFDHQKKTLRAIFDEEKKLAEVLKYKAAARKKLAVKVEDFSSNFSDETYLAAIDEIKKQIAAGDFYQTNLTRKFFGNFDKKLDLNSAAELFFTLTKSSPANYSAFLKIADDFVISSSPELFLRLKNGDVLSRPIKGTAPRAPDSAQDLLNKKNLQNSPKERAENLMIVDLVRNDLARVCEPASVLVKKSFAINSYKNVHHMSSEIHGKILPNCSSLEVLAACFAPGSMTGAPKIKAMEVAAKKEKIARGIYSGALGVVGLDELNLSVVIRTLFLRDKKFEFQVGGAITFDSKKEDELAETYAKAAALFKLLKLDVSRAKKKK
jgi:para-aminobenzoate synthetase component 1